MRRGFTLIELALVLSITGLLLGIALPKLGALQDSLAVEHAAAQIVSAHQRARIVAITRSRSTLLTVAQGTLSIRLEGDTGVLWESPGPGRARCLARGPAENPDLLAGWDHYGALQRHFCAQSPRSGPIGGRF